MPANSILPHTIAVTNAVTLTALMSGYAYIRSGNRAAHRACMITAVVSGAIFLVQYLSYHFGAGLAKFGGEGVIRPAYFSILIAHIIASAVATPLVPLTFWRGYTGRFEAHRKLAPLAFKIWLFVTISGLVVYAMTIHIWPYRGDVL